MKVTATGNVRARGVQFEVVGFVAPDYKTEFYPAFLIDPGEYAHHWSTPDPILLLPETEEWLELRPMCKGCEHLTSCPVCKNRIEPDTTMEDLGWV